MSPGLFSCVLAYNKPVLNLKVFFFNYRHCRLREVLSGYIRSSEKKRA